MEHKGALLEKAVRNSDVSITDLAKKLNVNRRTLYYWFNKKYVRVDVMHEIGKIIHRDFSDTFIPARSGSSMNETRTSGNINPDINYWKDKYRNLLDKYENLLQKQ
ncbi:hypothetical protein [Rubrolithibacter danxiaensis]|uniref:hypothetical protein n=1 Tax=Rubrolithibacter danxiaensis TaxID=3390805 RepID=UPI003BF80E89